MIEAVFWEWLNLGIRWLHAIAGIAWIGGSFHFVHTDSSLKKCQGLPEGAGGETWQVHGGGFYRIVKYLVAPARMPEDLTWFRWEAYATWLSGFGLLVILYYFGAELYLIDRSTLALPVWLGISISLGGIVAGWLVYDGLCKSKVGRDERLLLGGVFLFLVVLAWLFSFLFSGRGAYLQMGAILGTMMAANVAHHVVPNQRKVVAALAAGREPDPKLGAAARQRSVHNNYLTLPVLFVMISNHYPLAFASRYNWLIFGIVLVVGAVIRHFYDVRHQGLPSPWWTWGVAAAGMVAIVLLSTAGPAAARG